MSWDVIVAGGGHNGLVCATRLARAGKRVLVVERRSRVGGIAEVVLTAGRLDRAVVAELELERHGLQLHEPEVRLVALTAGEDPLVFWADSRRTADGLRDVSAADAESYVAFDEHVRLLAGFVGRLNASTPPRLDRPTRDATAELVGLGGAFRGLGTKGGRELTRALPMAVADFVAEWFEHDRVRAALAARGTRFTAMGPWSAGTALLLLNDSAGNDGGAAGESVQATGLTDALTVAATAAGVEIRTDSPIAGVIAPNGRVAGVTLEDGEQLWAPVVAAAVDPKTVLTRWVDPVVAGPQLRWRAGNFRTPGRTARVTLELSALPEFTGLTSPEHLAGRILTAPGIDALEQAFDSSKYGEMSEVPMIEAVIPTALDAAAESHRLEALVQWVPPGTTTRMVGDRTVKELERHAPGIKGLITGRTVLTPDGLEEEYGLAGGHVLHGELGLDQFFAWRPAIGLARHRLAIPGLYLCGSGAHPGGGLTGLPGAHAAKAILADS